MVNGWGLPNLKKAMQGPGQFVGALAVALPAGTRDIWANDISDEAIRARRSEDAAEQATWSAIKQQKAGSTVYRPGPRRTISSNTRSAWPGNRQR